MGDYTGRYALQPDVTIRLFLHDGQPFIHVPGEGEGELVPVGDDRFRVRAADGVTTVEFIRGEGGRVTGLVGHLPGYALEADRLP